MASNADSILHDVKKICQISETDDAFDIDIIMHINSTFSVLNQIGIGPTKGYMIAGKENTWSEFIEPDPNLNMVKSYVGARVRRDFDPPTTSYAIEALNKVISEYEARLSYMEFKPAPVADSETRYTVERAEQLLAQANQARQDAAKFTLESEAALQRIQQLQQ